MFIRSADTDSKGHATIELESGDAILLRDVSEVSNGKSLRMDPTALFESRSGIVENGENTYPRLEFINGSAYMVTGHLDLSKDVWEIKSEKSKKKECKTVLSEKKVSTSRIGRHPCPRDGCSKVYSTPHHLKVKVLYRITV